MSRALYHLSYGTAEAILPSSPHPRLRLALLQTVLRDRYALPLVHCLRRGSIARLDATGLSTELTSLACNHDAHRIWHDLERRRQPANHLAVDLDQDVIA